MHRSSTLFIALLVTLGTTAGLPALAAQTGPVTDAGQPYDKLRAQLDDLLTDRQAPGELRVGVGEATTAFRAGAKPGQVGTDAGTSLDEGPYPYATAAEPGDGWHDHPMAKAFVIERADGERFAIVKTDLYLMQHSIHKRVADLVVDSTGVDRQHLFLQGNHDHSHPYGMSPSWGLCLFSDCFDLRQWSYMTRQIAASIEQAAGDLRPATISAAETSYDEVQRNVIGPSCATTMANGTGPQRALAIDQTHQTLTNPQTGGCVKAGFPREHVDPSMAIIRFDEPDGTPIGAILSLAMHPESLDGPHGLTSSDYAGMVERGLEDHVGATTDAQGFIAGWFVGALGDVEPASASQDGKKDWWRETFARTEDMVSRMMPEILSLYHVVDTPAQEREDVTLMEPTRELPIGMVRLELPPPQDKPWGPDNSYITEQGGWGIKVPSTRSAQETASAWLVSLRLGDVLIAGFPGEPITDLALNFKSRVNIETGDVYQGYHWDGEPGWVHDRIEQNFDTDELAGADGFRIPLMFGVTSDWTGYYVTKWEYENRNHYRESMMPYGPDGAEHVVGTLVEMAGQLAGGPQATTDVSPTRAADDAILDAQYGAMVAGEQAVRGYRAAIPANQGDVGTLQAQPTDVDRFETAQVTWVGGSNAVDLPLVELQQERDGVWTTVADSSGHEIVVRMEDASIVEDPDQANPLREWTWTASWEVPWDQPLDTTYRFAIEGTYRSDQPDPARSTFFDPAGADRTYQTTSQAFGVADTGGIPVNDVRDNGAALRFTFEPNLRDSADPDIGTELAGELVPEGGGSSVDVTLTYSEHGWFHLDKGGLPSGPYTLEAPAGAWVDPAGNPSQAVSLPTSVP